MRAPASEALAFVVQKHAATRLHYDFRLELDGVMRSWAVPKGPSFDPKVKRMAVETEDHPVSYNAFEGTIPKGEYGAGEVIVWDRATWQPLDDPRKGLAAGKLAFTLQGEKLHGAWELIRTGKPGAERQTKWLLFKKHDAFERPESEYDVVAALPDSVIAQPTAKRRAPRTAPTRARKTSAAQAAAELTLPEGARKAAVPEKLAPQLATLVDRPPARGDWIYEVKFDGYRILTRFRNGAPALLTRRGFDWSDKMPELLADLRAFGLDDTWLDGEIVVMNAGGAPDFNALQNAFDHRHTKDIRYFVFDAPFLNGHDLRHVPLSERRAALKALFESKATDRVRFSEDFPGGATDVLKSACAMKLEGVIAKRADAPYVSARTDAWLKLKCTQRQEFVIVGFTDRKGDRRASGIGSLLVAVHDDRGALRFAGSVGTGWDTQTAADLKKRLEPLEIDTPAFDPTARPKGGRWSRGRNAVERWVRPELVAEVSFGEWTPDGQLRHASFEGLRADTPAGAVTKEVAVAPPAPKRTTKTKSPAASAGTATRVTHPERVVDPSTGITKLDLVRYYESVAPFLVPHLKGRPCSLVRGPDGLKGELFFQKHLDRMRIADVRQLDPSLWPGHAPLLEMPSAKAIAAAAQMNVIEFHTWNAPVRNLDNPDRVVFDVDPGEGVAWPRVLEAASLTRTFLKELGLEAWLKTSGGKGLHLVVPLAPRHPWQQVRTFSQAVVEHLARVIPDRFVARSGASNRVGRIFVDYLRNTHGATTAAAFSARARPGLGVSMPVAWSALESLKAGDQWTIRSAREHLSFQRADPWADYASSRQTLTAAMKALGTK